MTNIKDIISESIKAYNEKGALLHSPTLTEGEKKHWSEYLRDEITKKGWHYSNYIGSPLAIKADIYDNETLFNGGRINLSRVNAFREWCADNGICIHTLYSTTIEILPEQMVEEMRESGEYDITEGGKRGEIEIRDKWNL